MAVSLANLNASRARVRAGYGTRVRPAWEWDVPAIERACKHLGIRQPVELAVTEMRSGRWVGLHSYEAGAHRVRLARWLEAEHASEVLWHELTHASQRDRGTLKPNDTSLSQRSRLRADEYAQLPNEREAIANEQLARERPLVRPA